MEVPEAMVVKVPPLSGASARVHDRMWLSLTVPTTSVGEVMMAPSDGAGDRDDRRRGVGGIDDRERGVGVAGQAGGVRRGSHDGELAERAGRVDALTIGAEYHGRAPYREADRSHTDIIAGDDVKVHQRVLIGRVAGDLYPHVPVSVPRAVDLRQY